MLPDFRSPCTCTVSKAGMSRALDSLIPPFTWSKVKALLFFIPSFADLLANNVAQPSPLPFVTEIYHLTFANQI